MEKIYDIIIIGGGTAGMTAAIYGCRSGKQVLIIEKSFFGGQIISTPEIENYPAFPSASGYSFATELHSQIQALDVKQVSDEAMQLQKEETSGCWHVICKKESYSAKTVIIACGTESRKLGLAGEDKFLGHGISHCATCDGALYKNRTATVVGGGNTALEEALYLSLLCNKVYLIHRKSAFRGDASLQRRIGDAENIHLLLNSQITALHGQDKLQAIEYRTCGQSSGSEHESADGGANDGDPSATLETDALFVAIGQIPQNQAFADTVALDHCGYIIAGEDCRTNAPGVFAAGDCRTKSLRQLVTAASDGATAATEAIKYLK